jgi:hypothetical protein
LPLLKFILEGVMDWKQEIKQLVEDGMTTYKAVQYIKDKYKIDGKVETLRYYARKGKAGSLNYNASKEKKAQIQRLVTENVKCVGDTQTRQRIIEIKQGQEITPAFLLQAHGLNGEWQVISYVNNFWDTQQKGGEVLQLYQSKITVKPIGNDITFEGIKEHFNSYKPKAIDIKSYCKTGDNMAVVNIADLHLGKLAWHGDCGENFDHKVAQEIFYKIISDIYSYLEHKQLEYILFIFTNDFFNSDTIDKTTTGQTKQDTDVRWQKLFNVGCEMLVTAIDTLRHIAPVKTLYTRSNHDQMVSYYAICYLSAWYKQTFNVEVDIDAFPRKYIKFGEVLLGFAHGDKEGTKSSKDRASRLASLMPIEAKEKWGQTRYREYQTAHLHSEHTTHEINGVIVRRVSSPTGSDTWHTENGYCGATRKAQTFIYNKSKGLTDIHNTPV